MTTQGPRDFLHRFQLRAQGADAPLVQELASPGGADVLPELLEVFAQQVSTHAPQVGLQQLRQLDRLPVGQVLAAFQQARACLE